MTKPIELSIIIPAYMEAAHIADTLDRLADFLTTRDYGEVEVIVVTADSTDGTAAIAQSRTKRFKHFKLVQPGPRVGKGRDVRAGIFEASGRYRLFMDADLATPLHHLDEVHRLISEGSQVGIAVRNLIDTHKTLKRKVMTSIGNILVQTILLPGLKDTQCGFKFFEAKAAEAIFSRMTITGWGFDLEILAIARKLGYSIATIEISDWTDPKAAAAGLSGDSNSRAALQVLRDLFKVRWNLFRGLYRRPSYSHR